MSTGAAADYSEAVIISGRRRGEIVRLVADTSLMPEPDWRILNDGLSRLNAKSAALSKEVRAAAKTLNAGNKRR